MLREVTVANYKSIVNHTMDLGRVNVLIGENGCGKTNILEAVAMAAAALEEKLDVEELHARGIRVARPTLTFSSFLKTRTKASDGIKINLRFQTEGNRDEVELRLVAKERSTVDIKWSDANDETRLGTISKNGNKAGVRLVSAVEEAMAESKGDPGERSREALVSELVKALDERAFRELYRRIHVAQTRVRPRQALGEFAIYNLNVLALRGIQNVSRRIPLGIYGENLDVAISAMSQDDREKLLDRAQCISWLDDIVLDTGDELKHQGYKFGRSTSTLYFRDKFMPRKNNIFSAENANEGILHILFYLVLFASANTPRIFGIDNIETALNPQLCREVMKRLVELAKENDKQALITTHNPAILDGLNLHDDEQRLFVVSRGDQGETVTKRIKLKPEPKGGPRYKLSELWMRGHLGGIPERF